MEWLIWGIVILLIVVFVLRQSGDGSTRGPEDHTRDDGWLESRFRS